MIQDIVNILYIKALELFGNKQAAFRFRGIDLTFTLSQGLFSSADIDAGTRFLLKILSKSWDEDKAEGRPVSVLDAGSGVGIIGAAVAAALLQEQRNVAVRCQDRDELARVFTAANAKANHISSDVLEAHTEPLLDCPPESAYNLIISNIPAKTGKPVLEDFVRRSAELLSVQGKVFVVIVNPLAELFRAWILEADLCIIHEETGKDHTVFVYGRGKDYSAKPRSFNMTSDDSFYVRQENSCGLEGQLFTIRTFHGAADFDNPGMLIQHTAKLINKMNLKNRYSSSIKMLIHEPGQGHLPLWLSRYFEHLTQRKMILSGRNIISLKASQYNLEKNGFQSELLPAVDLGFDKNQIEHLFGKDDTSRLIIAFPEPIPKAERFAAIWEGLYGLLRPEDIAVMGFSAAEADRFDRIKPKGFSRMSDLKRNGFKVMAYKRT